MHLALLMSVILEAAPAPRRAPAAPYGATPSARCSCARWREVRSAAQADTALAEVPVVFVGRVVALTPLPSPRDIGPWQRAQVVVERPFKGVAAGETVVVDDGQGGGDCGLGMVDGGRYLLFLPAAPRPAAVAAAPDAGTVPYAGGCSGSMSVRNAGLELRLLRAARARRDAPAARPAGP